MSRQAIRVGVVGVGAFGQHHARVFADHPDVRLVGVLDSSLERAHEIAERHGCRVFPDLRSLVAEVDAVSLATPATIHAELAAECLEHGIHLLVEKPIATSIDDANRLIDLAERRGLIVQVGHLERFNAALNAVRGMISHPFFIDVQRLSPFSHRGTDVDVVRDLMIHDLDLLLWLIRDEVAEVRAAGLRVTSPHIDFASARIVFQNGCVANLTASRVAIEKVRTMTIAQPEHTIVLNHAGGAAWIYPLGRGPTASDADGPREIRGNTVEPLKQEIDAFLASIQGHAPPAVSAHDGLAALRLAQLVMAEVLVFSERVGRFPFHDPPGREGPPTSSYAALVDRCR